MDERKDYLTTNQGVRVGDNQNSLKGGERGPTLLEDFILREKITHFDHERIPERVVHARGAGAHGTFKVHTSLAKYTKAGFLQEGKQTRVFVRFSTVAGSRGSADTARDVRGFATKFYTEEGVFDLVGNNIPVFFIQDAMKFPDLIHSVKPEPHNEIPQAASAHDTFWDFVSLTPESTHMLMWAMSDRAIPRSLRMMEGFGVNTYRFVNADGVARLVKFHWKPKLGVHSLVWDESLKLGGADPDFHRKDLWEAIDKGDFPQWEFGVQVLEETPDIATKHGFDPLDPTKLWPESIVPVELVATLTLDRNPDNFFAETEQVAFCPSHVVPGIDFSNDPLLQGRLFSYLDTQLSRLGSPNFHELPINRAECPVSNNQRDAHMRSTVNKGRVAYQPNSLAGGCPFQAGGMAGGFVSHAEKIEAHKIRGRSPSFGDHYSQAELFWRNQSDAEKEHIVSAFRFELAKVESKAIRRRMVDVLTNVDADLALRVAAGLGLAVDDIDAANKRLHADWQKYGVTSPPYGTRARYEGVLAPELSMAETVKDTIKTRKIAVLVADGVDGEDVDAFAAALRGAGATVEVIAPTLAAVARTDGKTLVPDRALPTVMSVLYDAVYVPGGPLGSSALEGEGAAVHFINEAFMHAKAIAATGAGVDLLLAASLVPLAQRTDEALAALPGVIAARHGEDLQAAAKRFIDAVAQHRHFGRKHSKRVPA